MARGKVRVEGGSDISVTDSENELLSASYGVGDESDGDESESGSISIDKGSDGGDGDSSCDEATISELIRSRAQTVGLKRKVEEGVVGKGKEIAGKVGKVSKGKEIVEGVEPLGTKKLKTLRIPTFSCLGSASGWLECVEKFVLRPVAFQREEYFRVYGTACSYKSPGGEVSDVLLSEDLGKLEHINRPCNFDPIYLPYVKAAFQIPSDYEVRMPESGEMIYHRGGDMWVGIPLEHLRAGLRLPMHRFFHTLLVSMRVALG